MRGEGSVKVGIKGEARFPSIDLNDPRHRNAFIIFTITTIIVLFLSTLGSFQAYHITESVEFCGTLCHQVMEPEYTAYQNSPHANVACVECHVGSGASWYVKSKLSGLAPGICCTDKHLSHALLKLLFTIFVLQERHAKNVTGLRNSMQEHSGQINIFLPIH